jgi:GDP-mannose 6-dehydrogenase
MNVSVFGLGYVGCVSAACLARSGHRVWGVDVNVEKVDMINRAQPPIVEPGLAELLADVVGNGRLTATANGDEAVASSDLALICVGTPGLGHGEPDLRALERVGRQIGRTRAGRSRDLTVVLRSTVLPGTTEGVLVPALRHGGASGPAPRVAMNPEFMREGTSLCDFDHPPMVLVGSADPVTTEIVRELYADVQAPFVQTTLRTAELVKFTSNAYHGLKVCFANEIGDLCDALGADGAEVMRIFAMDRKLNISEAYLQPGFAFGGSCLPKDVRALLWAARSRHVDAPVLSAIMPSNTGQVGRAIEAVLRTGRRRVGVAGLAFKPGTDDLRESPVVALVEALIGKGRDVRILDRNVSLARLMGANRRYIEAEIPHIASLLCDDVEHLLDHAEVLVIGSSTEDAAKALSLVPPDCVVVDLTRGATGVRPSRPSAEPTFAER